MSDVPPGWTVEALGDVAVIQGGIQKQPKRAPSINKHPFLRVANVTSAGLDLSDVHSVELFDGELSRYRLARGDLLVVEGNGSPSQIGRAAVWNGAIDSCVHQNHLIRVRPGPAILPEYLGLVWNGPRTRQLLTDLSSSSSGLHTLSVAKLKRVTIPVPPLSEQRRIVELLEDHLSRLDAADTYVSASAGRAGALTRSILESIVPMDQHDGWRMTTVGQAGRLQLGRARHPDWHNGPEMRPYLRVANIFEDRIVTDDVMTMDFSGVFDKYRLHPGDILLNEGQSPHLLGRPAIYRGQPAEVAFTNSLIRFQASAEVLPEWALLVFRRHMHSGRFKRESRITTNIAHLSMSRLRDVEFPVPPLEEQDRRVKWAGEALQGLVRLRENAAQARKRSLGLRRAVLEAAFSGRLTGRAGDLERVQELAGAAS